MEKKMPKDFYWGGSVSSFQTEGARNEGGKGVCIYDVRPMNPEFSDWNVAIDEYHRYDEDIALMKEMGFNFYRFSICWSRIIPNGTLDEPVNEEGVKFYSDLIDKLLAAGIEAGAGKNAWHLIYDEGQTKPDEEDRKSVV